MMSDTEMMRQIEPYLPVITIIGVLILFALLRFTRKELRKRVDEIGYRTFGEKGLRIWFWLNAPGVILHELSHAFVVFLFRPFGFRITSITLFRIKPVLQRDPNGRIVRSGGRQALQLGEVQYVRPQGRFMSYVGDGLSGIAPLFGGIAMFMLLYWIATGYNIWDIPIDANQRIQILRPGWPWWTLLFAPYLILTVTSELWPSRQDWHGARWFVIGLAALLLLTGVGLWYFHYLKETLLLTSTIAAHFIFALLVLLALDIAFLIIGELLVRLVRR